jgi:iron(III) transport system ATP-binding protein
MQPLLDVTGLEKRFGPALPPAVDGVSFAVGAGEVFALLGPSGCGKTTTLRLVAGFERPDAGTVRLEGRDITGLPPEQRRIGFVFQDYALFPHLSAFDNVSFGLRRTARRLRRARALELLELVGLAGLERRMPDQLSGGQQQRVALARALGAEPELILLDEPFSNLDATLRQATRAEVRALLKAAGTSAVLVTHDQEEALTFCDRLALMRAGRIEQVGTPEEVYHRPRTPFAAQFLGRTNLLAGTARGCCAETLLGRIPLANETRGRVLLSLRPEHLSLEPESGETCREGVVLDREFRGHDLAYRIGIDGTELHVLTDYAREFAPGSRVRVVAREAAVVVEPDAGEPDGPPEIARAAE